MTRPSNSQSHWFACIQVIATSKVSLIIIVHGLQMNFTPMIMILAWFRDEFYCYDHGSIWSHVIGSWVRWKDFRLRITGLLPFYCVRQVWLHVPIGVLLSAAKTWVRTCGAWCDATKPANVTWTSIYGNELEFHSNGRDMNSCIYHLWNIGIFSTGNQSNTHVMWN